MIARNSQKTRAEPSKEELRPVVSNSVMALLEEDLYYPNEVEDSVSERSVDEDRSFDDSSEWESRSLSLMPEGEEGLTKQVDGSPILEPAIIRLWLDNEESSAQRGRSTPARDSRRSSRSCTPWSGLRRSCAGCAS